MAYTPAPYAVIMGTRPGFAPEISLSHQVLYKVISPYQPSMWQLALHDANIHTHYPNLVHDLTYESPIGNPPRLEQTFILPNLPSAKLNPIYILHSLSEEVASGHMDGPFSIPEVHHIFGGHFCTLPLGLVEKAGSTTEFHLIRHLSKLNASAQSTNSWLDAKDSPTHYFSAAQCADLVSTLLPSLLHHWAVFQYAHMSQGVNCYTPSHFCFSLQYAVCAFFGLSYYVRKGHFFDGFTRE
jgi:hypothetical protein